MAIDLKWKIPEAHKLWIKWKKVEHLGSGKIRLHFTELFGPVLNDCEPLEEKGHINLDLTKHLIVITPAPYIITFNWGKLISQDSRSVKLDEVIIDDTDIGLLKLLQNNDSILLDCTGHTTENEARGYSKWSFEAIVYNSDGQPFNFNSK